MNAKAYHLPPAANWNGHEHLKASAIMQAINYPAPCAALKRVGPPADGGYVVPDLAYDYCLTVGVAQDVRFEAALGVRCDLYDPTIRAAPRLPGSRWHPHGLGAGHHPLARLMANSPPAGTCNLLKIDCEGGEWTADFAGADLSVFSAVVLEVHDLHRTDLHPAYMAVLQPLFDQFVLVNAHPNNYGGVFLHTGVLCPKVAELTFVRKDLYRAGDTPAGLNAPNNPHRPEITTWPAPRSHIPRTIVQVTKNPTPGCLRESVADLHPGWAYENFTDAEAIAFMAANPHPDFPGIVAKFKAIRRGEHKSDLFRYYYLFLKGGVYCDDDLVVRGDLDAILRHGAADFVSIWSFDGLAILNAFMGATPGHPIIRDALQDAYTVRQQDLDADYCVLIRRLKTFYARHKVKHKAFLYQEVISGPTRASVMGQDGFHAIVHHYAAPPAALDWREAFDCTSGGLVAPAADQWALRHLDDRRLGAGEGLLTAVPRDRNIVEVGAHCGEDTRRYAAHVAAGAKVYAFEPQTACRRAAAVNLHVAGVAGKVDLIAAGCFAKSTGGAMDSRTPPGGARCARGIGAGGEPVQLVALDDLKLENVGFMHLDAQGADRYVLAGAVNLIRESRPLIVFEDLSLPGGDFWAFLEADLRAAYPGVEPIDLEKFCAENDYELIRGFTAHDSMLRPRVPDPCADVFDRIYATGTWGVGSGAGSTPEYTAAYRAFLRSYMAENSVKSVLDIGCGDWQIGRLVDWTGVDYLGVDVAPSVVAANRAAFTRPGIRFEVADASTAWLPAADLVIVKDVLQHLSIARAQSIVEGLRGRRVLFVQHADTAANDDCADGGYRPLDLRLPPFNLPLREAFDFGDGKIVLEQLPETTT